MVKIYYKNKNSTSFLYISLKSRKTYIANFNGSPPLGRVFKIHDFFLHDFIGCLLSVSSMVKWVTPLGVR